MSNEVLDRTDDAPMSSGNIAEDESPTTGAELTLTNLDAEWPLIVAPETDRERQLYKEVRSEVDNLRKRLDNIHRTAGVLDKDIAAYHESHRYRLIGYTSFEKFLSAEFSLSVAYGHRIVAAQKVRALLPAGGAGFKESHARELVDVEPEQIPLIVAKAKEIAAERGETKKTVGKEKQYNTAGNMTSRDIRQARIAVLGPPAETDAPAPRRRQAVRQEETGDTTPNENVVYEVKVGQRGSSVTHDPAKKSVLFKGTVKIDGNVYDVFGTIADARFTFFGVK